MAGHTAFRIDYTFYLNLVFVLIAALMVWLHKRFKTIKEGMSMMDMESSGIIKKIFVYLFITMNVVGALLLLFI